jgi:hypothetical protein
MTTIIRGTTARYLLEGLCIREPPTHLVSWFSDALLAQYKNLEMNSEDQPRRLKVGTLGQFLTSHHLATVASS